LLDTIKTYDGTLHARVENAFDSASAAAQHAAKCLDTLQNQDDWVVGYGDSTDRGPKLFLKGLDIVPDAGHRGLYIYDTTSSGGKDAIYCASVSTHAVRFGGGSGYDAMALTGSEGITFNSIELHSTVKEILDSLKTYDGTLHARVENAFDSAAAAAGHARELLDTIKTYDGTLHARVENAFDSAAAAAGHAREILDTLKVYDGTFQVVVDDILDTLKTYDATLHARVENAFDSAAAAAAHARELLDTIKTYDGTLHARVENAFDSASAAAVHAKSSRDTITAHAPHGNDWGQGAGDISDVADTVNAILDTLQAHAPHDDNWGGVGSGSDSASTVRWVNFAVWGLHQDADSSEATERYIAGGSTDITSISGDGTAADNLEAMLDGTGAALTITQLQVTDTTYFSGRVRFNDQVYMKGDTALFIQGSDGPGLFVDAASGNNHGATFHGEGTGYPIRVGTENLSPEVIADKTKDSIWATDDTTSVDGADIGVWLVNNLRGGSCTGSGSQTDSVWVIDTSGTDVVVADAFVTVANSGNTQNLYWSTTNDNGWVNFDLDGSTDYTLKAHATGYIFDNVSITTGSDGSDSSTIKGYDIETSSPGAVTLKRVWDYIYDGTWDTLACKGTMLQAELVMPNDSVTIPIDTALALVDIPVVIKPKPVYLDRNDCYIWIDLVPNDHISPGGTKWRIWATKGTTIVLDVTISLEGTTTEQISALAREQADD